MFNLQAFLDLINSKCCTHEYYILNFSDLEKVDKTFFKITKYQSEKKHFFFSKGILVPMSYNCLLYTSDAADDTPCVDLGGRRIIKKKEKIKNI